MVSRWSWISLCWHLWVCFFFSLLDSLSVDIVVSFGYDESSPFIPSDMFKIWSICSACTRSILYTMDVWTLCANRWTSVNRIWECDRLSRPIAICCWKFSICSTLYSLCCANGRAKYPFCTFIIMLPFCWVRMWQFHGHQVLSFYSNGRTY